MSKIFNYFFDRIMAGIWILLPIVVSWWLLKFIFDRANSIFSPLTAKLATELFGKEIPASGFVLFLIIVCIVGFLAKTKFGQKIIIGPAQSVLLKIPVVKSVYAVVKKLTESFTNTTGLTNIVAVKYPGESGNLTLGYVTGEIEYEGIQYAAVYFPSPPSPQSGQLALVPKENIRKIKISPNQFLTFLITLGTTAPSSITPPKLPQT